MLAHLTMGSRLGKVTSSVTPREVSRVGDQWLMVPDGIDTQVTPCCYLGGTNGSRMRQTE
jgi:hypothetical protein